VKVDYSLFRLALGYHLLLRKEARVLKQRLRNGTAVACFGSGPLEYAISNAPPLSVL
jgi:hypothetical protein